MNAINVTRREVNALAKMLRDNDFYFTAYLLVEMYNTIEQLEGEVRDEG